MYDFDKSKRRITVIRGEIKALYTESSELYIEMQAQCTHVGTVVESPEWFTNVGTGRARLRICTVCGKVESDFFGYNVLGQMPAQEISSDAAFAKHLLSEELRYWGRAELHKEALDG